MSRNIIVTGASGVIGRRVTVMLASADTDWTVIPVPVNLRDQALVSEFCETAPFPDILLHLAATVPTEKVRADPLSAYLVNAVGTGTILQGLLKRNPRLWTLYASTSHVYQPRETPIPETACVNPITVYGRTKLAAEWVALDVVANASMSALCIARIFSVYSPDQHGSFLFPTLLSRKSSWDGKNPIRIRGWNNVRDFLSAEEVASRLIELINGRAQGVFNIGSGKGLTVLEFARQILNLDIEPSLEEKASAPTSLVADVSNYERYVNGITPLG